MIIDAIPFAASPDPVQLAQALTSSWEACRAVPVERRNGEDDQYLDARERFLAALSAHGIDRDAFVRAVA